FESQHRAGRGGTLPGRRLPMVGSQMTRGAGVIDECDVARCEDPVHGGSPIRVDRHAAVGDRGRKPTRVRVHAHADEDVIASDAATAGELERTHSATTIDALDVRAEDHRRALRSMQVREPAPHPASEHSRERRVERLDDRHVRAELERRGCHLETDEPDADYAGAEQQVDRALVVPRARPQCDRALRERAGQELLRQRWAVVRRMTLSAYEAYWGLVTLGPQRLGAALCRKAAADDDDAVAHERASWTRTATTARSRCGWRSILIPKSTRIGTPLASMKPCSHGDPASVPAPSACTIPSAHTRTVARCSLRHSFGPMR